jgi:putative metalloprotease
MIKILPFLLTLAAAILYARFLAWRSVRELDQRSVELMDPGLRPLLGRLAEALGIERIKVHLLDIPMVNALASADGRVFVTRGMYERHRAGQISAEEVAGVIAHELGHVALGHSRRRMLDFAGQNVVGMGLAMVLGRLIPVLGVWIAQALMRLVAAGLSRRDEYEADAYATALLIKAGIGTEPQKSLFRKLGALTGRRGAQPPAWLLTHPRVEQRIQAIEANEARWLGRRAAAEG